MKIQRYMPMAFLLLMTACGGGGDNSTMGPPSPTPTPTPTPTPAAYQPAFDFTRDRSFTGLVTASTTQTIPARLVYGGFDSGTIAYTAATQALAAFSTTIVPNATGASLAQTDASLSYLYSIGTSPVTLTIYRGPTDVTYVSYLLDDELVKPIAVTRLALIGAPTLAADLPLAGSATYRLTVAQIGTSPAGQTLVVDFTGKRVSGSVPITPTGSATPISVVFQGIVDSATGRFDGTAGTADGAFTGAFHGRLYGPAGVEIGLVFDLIDRNGNDAPGVILGLAG